MWIEKDFVKKVFERGTLRMPSAPEGRSERSEHIDKSLTTHRAECDRDFACFILEMLKYL